MNEERLHLWEICLLYNTDKNVYHSYIDNIYEELFKELRDSTESVLEIGVEFGSSLCMWRDYFTKAKITGVDKNPCRQVVGKERIEFIQGDAYTYDMINNLPSNFDIIIDDGPHTLESITFVALEYSKKIKEKGVLIIEDFQDFNWTNVVKREIPECFNVQVKDLRMTRGRYDDIAMIITKA